MYKITIATLVISSIGIIGILMAIYVLQAGSTAYQVTVYTSGFLMLIAITGAIWTFVKR